MRWFLIVLAVGFVTCADAKPIIHKMAPVKALGLTNWIANANAKLLSDAIADLTATKALADAQKDPVASQCYAEILAEVQAIQTAQTGNSTLPPIHIAYTFQTMRGFANAAQPNSALNTACAPLAQQVKMSVLQLVNAIVTGGIAATTLGPLFGIL